MSLRAKRGNPVAFKLCSDGIAASLSLLAVTY
jgi:hypothetical protein